MSSVIAARRMAAPLADTLIQKAWRTAGRWPRRVTSAIWETSSGNAQLDYVDNRIVLSGSNSIIGHGLILHAQPDDLASQPTGNAGARIACGVIGVGKP
jgi:hypothetical protein